MNRQPPPSTLLLEYRLIADAEHMRYSKEVLAGNLLCINMSK